MERGEELHCIFTDDTVVFVLVVIWLGDLQLRRNVTSVSALWPSQAELPEMSLWWPVERGHEAIV